MTHKRNNIALVAVLLFASSLIHCRSNFKHCVYFVRTVNYNLDECGMSTNDYLSEDLCSEELNNTDASCADFYACLADSMQCVDGNMVTPDEINCGSCFNGPLAAEMIRLWDKAA